MPRGRLRLHEILCDILGSRNCYFKPPANITMQYPCIVYELEGVSTRHADDRRYLKNKRYSLTVIDHDPDSPIVDRLINSGLKYLEQNDSYVSEGLQHFLFTLYY